MSQPKTTPVLSVLIPLTVPVPVASADGKTASRDSLTINRPRTTHAKRLAVLIGADLFKGLFADASVAAVKEETVDAKKLASDVFATLLTTQKLDDLTGIIASMCDETNDFIDQLDLVDLWAVAKGFADFFPALQSLVSGALAPNAPSSIDGEPQTLTH